MRPLIYCPIIHTAEDLGELAAQVQETGIDKIGSDGLRQKTQALDRLWDAIEAYVDNLEIPFEKLRVYQDGLPICGREYDIVKQMAETGSRNHQLLVKLTGKGAVLMGTEDPALLVAEYEWIKAGLARAAGSEPPDPGEDLRAAKILRQRDRYIAARINQTLKKGEFGILFIGMLHRVDEFFDADIRIIRANDASQ